MCLTSLSEAAPVALAVILSSSLAWSSVIFPAELGPTQLRPRP